MRIALDGRELRAGVRTGIRRYCVEVLRAAASRGLSCVVYGDRSTRLEPELPGVSLSVLDGALAGAGVRAIVAEGGPLDDGDWTRLGDGHTWARLVSGPAPRAPQAPQARVR